MIKNKKISLIIPCKNEEKSLPDLFKKIPGYVDEIIVIDNMSTDKTFSVAKRLCKNAVKEKRQVKGIGYGFAHQKGLEIAKGDILVAMDGDGTYPPDKIKKIVNFMETYQLDFISCSRFPLNIKKSIPIVRQLGVHILNLEVRFLFGYKIKDILTGMWVLRKEAFVKMSFENGDWNFSPEIKLAALINPEINFAEYHIAHKFRIYDYSKQNIWSTGFKHCLYILQKRLKTKAKIFYFLNNILAIYNAKQNSH